LDAAVMWEPTTSRLVDEGLARLVATGQSVQENDGGFLAMRGSDQGAAGRGESLAAGRARRAAFHRRSEERARGDQDGQGADHRLLREGAVELALRPVSRHGRRRRDAQY